MNMKDAVRAGRARRRDRVRRPLQLERRREHRRRRRAHRARHAVRPNAPVLARLDGIERLADVDDRGAALAEDAAHARRGDPGLRHGQQWTRRVVASFGKISAKFRSFSAVSAPIFARKYAFCSIFQNLPDYQAEFFEIWQTFANF